MRADECPSAGAAETPIRTDRARTSPVPSAGA
jgi:hypothetical protein